MKAYRSSCAWEVKTQGWKSQPFQRASIEVEYRAWRGCGGYQPKDLDNAMASFKSALDSLRDGGVIASDAKNRLSWESFRLLTTRREIEREGKMPGVTVIVRAQ